LQGELLQKIAGLGTGVVDMPQNDLATEAAQRLMAHPAPAMSLAAATHKTLDLVLSKVERPPGLKWGQEAGVSKMRLYQRRVSYAYGRVQTKYNTITLPQIRGQPCQAKRAKAAQAAFRAMPDASRTTPEE
jgi:hypothetical protein